MALARKYGDLLATEVMAVMGSSIAPIEGKLNLRYDEIELEYDKIPTAEEVEAQLSSTNKYEAGRAKALKQEIAARGSVAPSYPYPIQTWKLGDGPVWVTLGGEVVAPREASREQLLRVHTAEHVRRMAETTGISVALDPDTYTSPGTAEVARLSAGAAVDAVERVMGGGHKRALVLSRPPGHHAEADRAMGFCLFNNVAICALHALEAHRLARVAVVDVDVHHGNGTQDVAERDPRIFFASTHQFPAYPGTGRASERGHGNVVNVPLVPGSGSAEFRSRFADHILPALKAFQPQFLFISAGFDAHKRDPLAQLALDEDDFAWATAELLAVARSVCSGRVVSTLEGGYDLDALAASASAHVRALMAA